MVLIEALTSVGLAVSIFKMKKPTLYSVEWRYIRYYIYYISTNDYWEQVDNDGNIYLYLYIYIYIEMLTHMNIYIYRERERKREGEREREKFWTKPYWPYKWAREHHICCTLFFYFLFQR